METVFIVNPFGVTHEVIAAHAERLLDESDPNDTFMLPKVKMDGTKVLAKAPYRLATDAEKKVVTDATAKAAAHNRRVEHRQELIEQADDERIDRMAELAGAGSKKGSK